MVKSAGKNNCQLQEEESHQHSTAQHSIKAKSTLDAQSPKIEAPSNQYWKLPPAKKFQAPFHFFPVTGVKDQRGVWKTYLFINLLASQKKR
jgi:hypothetical protein